MTGVRARLAAHFEQHPGSCMSTAEAAVRFDAPLRSIYTHLNRLKHEGLVCRVFLFERTARPWHLGPPRHPNNEPGFVARLHAFYARNPREQLTQHDMASKLGSSVGNVRNHVSQLRRAGVLRRVVAWTGVPAAGRAS